MLDLRQGTVLYTAFNEPVTIDSIFGEDRSPFQLDHYFFRWYDAGNAQGARVAVKVYDLGPQCEYVFQQEQNAAKMLAHPGIVRIIGDGRFDGHLFSVFEPMAGGTLRYWLQRYGVLTGADVLSVVRQIAEALDFAHARGIIHSGVQPGIVWLDPGPAGRAALAEFGVAKAEECIGAHEYPLPEGYFEYSAPEGATDARADIYSFGVMCYELIAGIRPWSLSGDFFPKRNKDAPNIRRYCKDVPKSVAQRLAQTLSRDPEARPRTAAAVLAGIEEEIAKLGGV